MKLQSNQSLKNFNTFGVEAKAALFGVIKHPEDLQLALNQAEKELKLILGGGSNLLLTHNIDGLVVKNEIFGKRVVEESPSSVVVEVGAGENWHQFVLWCLQHNYGGLENLSLIPGTVGAAPIQNIGAYGVELDQVFVYSFV